MRDVVCLLLLALGGNAFGQETPTTFPTDAQVVLLDMVVRDGRGHPMEDLRPDEVQVFEDGARCQVLSFRHVKGLAAQASGDASPPDLPNVPPARANTVALVFGELGVEAARPAGRGALGFLSRTFPPDTWFAVYKTGRALRLLHPFTPDPTRLQPAVEASTSGDLPRTRYHYQRLGHESIGQLREIIQRLRRVEGRKSVVYFSEGCHSRPAPWQLSTPRAARPTART